MDSFFLAEKLERLLLPFLEGEGYEWVDCEIGGSERGPTIRLLVDKKEGLTIADCHKLTLLLSPILEVENLFSGRYILEISSPGIDRPLRSPAHFLEAIGSVIQAQTKEPIDGRANFKGKLLKFEENKIFIEIDSKVYEIGIQHLKKANKVIDWDEVFKRNQKRSHAHAAKKKKNS